MRKEGIRLFVKTLGWAIISGIIFFLCAVYKECPWDVALFAALVASAAKTPAYPAWELVFNRIWRKQAKCSCSIATATKSS